MEQQPQISAAELESLSLDEIKLLAGSTFGISVGKANSKDGLSAAILAKQAGQPLPAAYYAERDGTIASYDDEVEAEAAQQTAEQARAAADTAERAAKQAEAIAEQDESAAQKAKAKVGKAKS